MAYYNAKGCTLHCKSCRSQLASSDIIAIALVPPSQHHLIIKQGCEQTAFRTIRKVDVLEENSKRSNRALFRLLCRACTVKVGSVELVEGNEFMCFKAEDVFLKDCFGVEKQEKKLKNLIPELEKCGIEKVKVTAMLVDCRQYVPREPPTALVYCDTSLLTRDDINSLTRQTPRDYQAELFRYAMQGNSLVFLPTGSGKTLVAAMAISCIKKLNPSKLAVVVVDRIPLAHQQAGYIKTQVRDLKVSLLTGDSPENESAMRKKMSDLADKTTDVLVLTHQIFLNILSDEQSVVQLSDVCLLVIDEAHRCQGNHPFNQIMRDHYVKLVPDKFKPLVLALTASPAGEIGPQKTLDSLQSLLQRLCCSARMPLTSQDLPMYTNKPQTFYKLIPLTPFQQRLESAIEKYLKAIGSLLERHSNNPEFTTLSPQASNYRGCIRQFTSRCHHEENLEGYALCELAMHLVGILEVNNVLGGKSAIDSLQECFDVIENESTPIEKQKKSILQSDAHFYRFQNEIDAIKPAFLASRQTSANEKFSFLVEELKRFSKQSKQDRTSRGILFVSMRKTAHKFCEILHSYPEIHASLNPKPFVGHGEGGIDGMQWQDEQQVTLKQFRAGRTKLLISTSVLEEGLDVPICNLVIRFDGLPSLRAHVQSRGRASRRADSKFILVFSDSKNHAEALQVTEMERNMEQSMRILHNISERHTTQAVKFACESRKPLFSRPQNLTEGNPVIESESAHRGSAVESRSVKASLHMPIKTDVTSELQSAIRFFNQTFDVKAMNIDANNENQPSTLHFELEHDEHEHPLAEFVEDLTLSWCKRGNTYNAHSSETWLEHPECTPRKRTVDVNVLSAESLFIGYFRHRTNFCRNWPNTQEQLRGIRLVFQHDLRSLLILFTIHEDELNLYEIEIQYNELASFILVDRDREYSDVFLSLKHPPKLFKTSRDRNELTWEMFMLVINEEENEVDGDSDTDSGLSSDEDDQEDDAFVQDVDGDDQDGGGDEDYDSNVQNDESIIHTSESTAASFSHPILGALDMISGWCRVPGTADNQVVFGQCLSYSIRVPNADLKDVMPSLQSYDKKIFFARIAEIYRPMPQLSEVSIPQALDQDVKYSLQCLFSSYPALLGRISTNFIMMIKDMPRNTAICGLQKLGEAAEQDYFCQPEETLAKILQTPNLRPKCFTNKNIPSHCALVKRLIVTPTSRLFGPEEVIQNNRVLRNYNPSNFLCVNIRDENFSKISGSSSDLTSLLLHLKRAFDEGIDVCGDRYVFLGCSNSQLRSHSCWFVKSTSNPNDIRRWMGDFSSIRCIGSYVSRMGQCFSTSLDAVGISIDQGLTWHKEQDIKSDDDMYCFSDGIGRISQDLADEVTKKIGKKFKPSAFQIRFAGYKGVLAVDSSLPGKTAYFRESMCKFKSNHRRLEVLATSRPQAVYLNHQVIMLLSNLGVPDEVFVKLMRNALDNLAGMLLDERKAVQQLRACAKTGIAYHNLSVAGISLTVEPFFRSIIAAVYYDNLHALLTKSRIKLDPNNARLMMGVMDETGVLQYGQVFVQYSECSNDPNSHDDFNTKKRHVLQGHVMVTRNPCLHPGDIRKLVAVDTPHLRHLVDCVVFPRVGLRPHPNEMAGGDLDGDLYFVSWHQDLLCPPDKELYPPMDYQAPPKKEKSEDVTPADMTTFLMDYIRSDQLGIIDNKHKAIADKEAQGIESENCLLLAEAHSLAVDAPKTGCWPNMSKYSMKVDKYPDFMMKTDKPSYKSVKVLGKLFRACQAMKRHTEKFSFIDVKRRPAIDRTCAADVKRPVTEDTFAADVKRPVIDRAFAVPGYEDFLKTASCLYLEYCGGLQHIMSSYGIDSEAKLVSGSFRKLYKRLSRERTEVAEIVAKLVEDLRMKYRKSFFQEFGMDDSRHKPQQFINSGIHQKAYAWYYVAYAEQPGTHSTRFLSFPWIVDDVMTSIRQVKKRLNHDALLNDCVLRTYPKENNVTKSLTKSLQNEKDNLLTEYKRRVSGKNQVAREIQAACRNHVQIVAFGSTATFLFRAESDVDLCAFYTNKATLNRKEQLKLLRSLEPVLRKLFTKIRLVARAKVPVISCTKFKSSEVPRYSLDVPFDVSASRDGLDKAIMVTCYIMSDPPLLPLLRFLITWADKSGLTGHGKRMIANSNALVFMFLSYCVSQRYVAELSTDVIQRFYNRRSFDCLQEWENVLSRVGDTPSLSNTSPSLGKVLIQFFASHNSILALRMPDSISKILKAKTFNELLNPLSITLLQEHLQRTYHMIALYGDLDSLLNISGAEVRHAVHLSTGLSNAMKGAERENAREMQERTGAHVCIRAKGSSVTSRLIVEASGTELQIAAVELILQNMTRTTLKAAFMSMCFVKGASQILFEGSRSDNDAVTLVPYHSNHHPQHDGTRLYTPMLATRTLLAQQNLEVFNSFKQKFIAQFRLAARDHEPSLHGVMEFVVHFGRIYIFRVPKSFIEDPESVTVKMLQANLNRGCKAVRTRADRPRRDLVITHSGVTRRNARRSRKKLQKQQAKKQKGDKMKEKPCRSSYFTRIRSVESAEKFLLRQRFYEIESREDFDVSIKGNEEFSVKFDHRFVFKELRFSPLRWCVTDVKRRWKETKNTRQQDGQESDVRFILQSRRALSKSEIHNTEYEVYTAMMQPPTPTSARTAKRQKQLPFTIKEELWNQVYMVRHKKTRRFRNSVLQSSSYEFKRSLSIDLTEVTEYSRPDCSEFRKVFTRHELNLQLEPPSFSADENAFSEFLLYVWPLAFDISNHLSI